MRKCSAPWRAAIHQHRHLLTRHQFTNEALPHVLWSTAEKLLDHIGGILLDAKLHHPALHLLKDWQTPLATPLFQSMLDSKIAIRTLHQIHGVSHELLQQKFLMVFGFRDALLEDTKPIRMMSHFQESIGHDHEDTVCDRGRKGWEKFLHHMRSWVACRGLSWLMDAYGGLGPYSYCVGLQELGISRNVCAPPLNLQWFQ